MCSNTDHQSKTMTTPEEKRNGTKNTTKPSSESRRSSDLKTGSNYTVSFSFGFVMAIMLVSTLASFQVGKLVRNQIVETLKQDPEGNLSDKPMTRWLLWAAEQTDGSSIKTTPTKEANSGQWIHCQDHKEDPFCSIEGKKDAATSSSSSSDDDSESDSDSSDDSEDDEGGGKDEEDVADGKLVARHLMLDLEEGQQSTVILKNLLKLVASKGWNLQSYQCTELSCTLIFEDDHQVVFRSNTGTLDIYSTDKEKTLLSWLKELSFVHVDRWAYKHRGTPWNAIDAGLNDMYNGLLGTFEFAQKNLVAREKSAFQEISFYDTLDPVSWELYQKSLSTTEDSYYTRNAHLFQPVRAMYLDGVVQSMSYGERAYHEALVHPSMMLHPNPERVALIGAGEGATLREVLKHSSVREVIMIEIDNAVMDLSRKHLPSWNDCSDLKLPEGMTNPTGNCFDDPRAKVFAEDAIRWFVDRYHQNDGSHEPFDLIIMDALDPGDKVEFSDMLFDNSDLAQTLFRALSPNGIFLSQTGEEEDLDDPNPLWTSDKHTILFQRNLAKVGFSRIFGYEEASTRFSGIWSFLLASKSSDMSRWYANPAQIDLELHQRAMPTVSGKWPFHYFDGATMSTYQASSRPVAVVTCRIYPHWPACQRGPGLGESAHLALDEALTIQNGKVVAQREIESGTIVGMEDCVHETWHVPHNTNDMIASFAAMSYPQWHTWKLLSSNYSMPAQVWGERAVDVDLSRFVWMQQCPARTSALETIPEGETNEMYSNFWRIHSCAARRTSNKNVEAGNEISCGDTFEGAIATS